VARGDESRFLSARLHPDSVLLGASAVYQYNQSGYQWGERRVLDVWSVVCVLKTVCSLVGTCM